MRSLLASFLLAFTAHAADSVLVVGSANVVAPLAAASPKLRQENVELRISSDQQNTSTALAAVGEGKAGLAIATRAITASERAAYSKVRLEVFPFAYQVVAPIVSREVWESGVRALTLEQLQGVYEGRITNWKELGGADQPIKFFNPSTGRGVWELFTTWIYEDTRKAPLGESFEVVSTEEEARHIVEFHAGGLTIAAVANIDQRGTFYLGLKTATGELLQPTLAAARAQTYPLSRQLDFVCANRPTGATRRLIEFFQTAAGRELLKQHDLMPPEISK